MDNNVRCINRLLSVLALVTATVTGPSFGQQIAIPPVTTATLTVVARATRLHPSRSEPGPAVDAELSAGALVIQLLPTPSTLHESTNTMVLVRVVKPRDARQGFVEKGDLVLLAGLTETNRHPLARKTATEGMPEVVKLQSYAIRAAWLEIADAIQENSKLEKPAPEPAFARGELWSLIGDHDSAFRDYLLATTLVVNSGIEPADYSSYFRKLHDALRNYERQPRSPLEGGVPFFLATEHFSRGFHAFWKNDLSKAREEIDDAIQLDPKEPTYWYYRALTHKRLGNESGAKHDALIGGMLDRQSPITRNSEFQRLQGGTRAWLERYRLGGGSLSTNDRSPIDHH
jgi:hypothetical protein